MTNLSENNAGLSVLQTIRNYGVDTIFGIPGTHNLEFYRHLDALGIKPVTSRHEQGAGYASLGWALQTGLPGVVITTSGPGLLNALSSVGTAYCESIPMIVLSPGVARGDEFADRGTLHETKDPTGAAGAIALWSRRVNSATEAVEAVHDAFELFATGRPRPVHIEIPLDILETETDCPPDLTDARQFVPTVEATQDELARARELLNSATRPVIIAGGGSVKARDELRAVAEKLGAPVVTTLNGKAALDEFHPLSLGAEIRLPAAHELVNSSDAVLLVGSKLGEAELWDGVIRPEGKVIRIDILRSQANKNIESDIALIGDSSRILDELGSGIVSRGHDENGWLGADSLATLKAILDEQAREISPHLMDVAGRISAAITPDSIVAGDSSQITYLAMSSTVRQTTPHSFLYTAAYATLGFGLPAAIGAKIASPHRNVVCVVGDGALMFAVQELVTAAEQRLDLTVVCVDNGGYAEIRQNEMDRGISPVGVDLYQPDWAALASAVGFTARRVSHGDDLTPVLADAQRDGGLQFVHITL